MKHFLTFVWGYKIFGGPFSEVPNSLGIFSNTLLNSFLFHKKVTNGKKNETLF